MVRIKIVTFFIITLLISFSLWAQEEHGILPIHTYNTSDYNGLQQIFDIKSDSRGIIYASNNIGLLELSGNRWKTYRIKNNGAVRSIDIDSEGRIFVGSDNEFGYFDTDSSSNGVLTYHSLSHKLGNNKEQVFGGINTIICKENKVYFLAKKYLYIWDYHNLSIHKSNQRFINLFSISNNVFVSISNNGYYWVNDSLQKVFSLKHKSIICSTAPFNKNSYLSYSNQQGLRLVSFKNGKLVFSKSLNSQISSIPDLDVWSLIKISDNLFSAVTNRGVFILNRKGGIVKLITKQHGLNTNKTFNQCLDINNTLWIATENGLSKISILSESVSFPQKACNYSDRIEGIKRFDNKINIITQSGLYQLDNDTTPISKIIKKHLNFEEHSLSKFNKFSLNRSNSLMNSLSDTLLDQLGNSCWDLQLFSLTKKKLLLVSTNDYVIGVDENNNVEKVAGCFPYTTYQSKIEPRRIYIGLDGGIQSSYYSENGKWINEGIVKGINEVIKDVTEDSKGNLWLGTSHHGIIFIKKPFFNNHKITKPKIQRLQKGLISGDPVRVLPYQKEMLFASSHGIYSFSWKDSAFYLNHKFDSSFNSPKNVVHRLSKDYNNNLWGVTINTTTNIANVLFLKKENQHYIEHNIFAKKDEVVNSFYIGSNNNCWYGGTYGLTKTIVSKKQRKKKAYYTYLTNVLNNTDTTFGGYYATKEGVSFSQPKDYIKTFDFNHNSFTFYFSSSSPEDFNKLNYSWYLEGYEHELHWGPWSDKTYKEYTNLNEGTYTFHVRSIDIYGNTSEETTYNFSITPPWYRTIWAFFAFIILFIAFVWSAIRLSTRGLKRIIKDATTEIQDQKDELEEKNDSIMDSIRYAHRIQEAVVPSSSLFHKYFKDSFVLWKPRDIVSGDFYWLAPKGKQLYVAAADCTGHGVPGALMSIMGISFLNQIVGSSSINNAADTLNRLRENVITSLNKEQREVSNKDGMDISLCIFDFNKMQIDFAGAYNSLYIIRNNELIETKADRMPIGVHERDNIPFNNKTVEIQPGDLIYMYSDGYIDQFGGPKGKKFMSKRFKKLLLKIQHNSMPEQKALLWNNFKEWSGEHEQIDDIIILGIRIE